MGLPDRRQHLQRHAQERAATRKSPTASSKRKTKKRPIIEIPDLSGSPEEVFDKKSKTEHIISCLEKLNQEQKEIIVLRDIHGFSYEEISEISSSCSIGTVKSRINRSRLRLREILAGTKMNR